MERAFCGKLATHTSLTTEMEAFRGLANLVKKLEKDPNNLDEYDRIIQDQLEQGIVERVTDEPHTS